MNQSQDSKPRKPKAFLLLSIITSLFIGVMGYELATKSTIKSERESSAQKFTILAKQPIASSNDKKQYASLNAQNQHLANKVMSLKEHSLELSRRLNLVQLSVFAARKSHDQAIIEEMQTKLEETELLNGQLKTNYATLQKNFNDQEAFSMNMESTIDHLSEMLELQKQSKEKAIEGLKSNLEVAATTEKNRLMQVIQGLEEHQEKLKDDLEKQSSAIARLEENLSESKFFAAENESALVFAIQQHEEKQKELYAQVENLSTLLNLEEIAVQSLQNEMQAFEENERNQALALQKKLDLTTMEHIHESMIYEDLARAFATEVDRKQSELDTALANLQAAETQINAQRTDIALLKEQRMEREQELIQGQEVLLADLALKQENLSLALSKFNSSEVSLGEQNQEILNLKDCIAKQEVDLAQIRSMASEQLQLNDRLAAQMLEKQDELNASLEKYDRADISLIEQHQAHIALKEEIAKREQELAEARDVATEKMKANQELVAELLKKQEDLTNNAARYAQAEANLNEQQKLIFDLKNQMLQREEEFTQINAVLIAGIAEKEESLALALAKTTNSETSIAEQTLEITILKDQLVQKEKEMIQIRELFAAEISSKEESILELQAKQEELVSSVSQAAQQEILTLREQMAQREKELLQANETLLVDIAQKEAGLAEISSKFIGSETNLSAQAEEISTLKEQVAHREQELAQIREMVASEMKNNQQIVADMTLRQQELSAAAVQFTQAEEQITALKDQMLQREQELLQANETLLAEIAQKEENLSLALAKLNGSELNATQQADEIASLKEQIFQHEQELALARENASEEMKNNQQLVADLLQKQDELKDTIAQFHTIEAQIQAQHQEVIVQKEQMIHREQELMQINEALLAEISQKEEALALALTKIESSELNINEQRQAVASLNEQIQAREQEFAQVLELTQGDQKRNQELLAELSEKQELLTLAVSQLATAESSITEHLDAIATLKQQMTAREQELTQVNAALVADIVQKEENLSLTLAKFDGSEMNLKEQSQALESLAAQIASREQELAQVREMALEEAKAHLQLIADMEQKQEELSTALAQKNNAEISLSQQHQEIVSLKEQMTEIEASYQETLNTALQKKEESDILLKNKTDELQALNEQLESVKEAAVTTGLAKTELSNELKNLQQELVTAFGKIEEMDRLASNQKQAIETLSSRLEETTQTMTAADSQKNVLMEEIINYKNALVNALTDYENEQKRAATLEQQLSSYLNKAADPKSASAEEKSEEEELRSLINQESFDDQATLEAPLLG